MPPFISGGFSNVLMGLGLPPAVSNNTDTAQPNTTTTGSGGFFSSIGGAISSIVLPGVQLTEDQKRTVGIAAGVAAIGSIIQRATQEAAQREEVARVTRERDQQEQQRRTEVERVTRLAQNEREQRIRLEQQARVADQERTQTRYQIERFLLLSVPDRPRIA